MSDNQTQAENVVNILDQYRVRSKPAGLPASDEPTGRVYRAYGIDAPQKRPTLIAIHYDSERETLVQKSNISRMVFTGHQHLSMIFADCVITLQGRHLKRLAELFQDEKILSLHCFDPKIHDMPTDDEIIITSIEERALGGWQMKKEKTG